MATIQHSGLIEQLKGKLHGSVFQSGPGGNVIRGGKMYCRTAMYNNNPQTSITPSISAAWKTLTPTQRSSWQAVTALYPSTDKFGNPRTPSAYCLYVSQNARLAALGLPVLTSAVAPTVLTDETGTTIGIGPTGPLEFNFPNSMPVEEQIIIEATPAFSQGRKMPIGYWRIIKHQRVGVLKKVQVFPQWENTFHAFHSGLIIYFRLRVLDKTRGQVSAPYLLSYIIP